jgi:transcriptional regulator with XRE-family HTH domain
MTTTMTVPTWTLADRLAKARANRGISQGELADILGLSLKTVSRYETGQNEPRRATLLGWALACGVDADWLIGSEQGTIAVTKGYLVAA